MIFLCGQLLLRKDYWESVKGEIAEFVARKGLMQFLTERYEVRTCVEKRI
jgi:hypothetical protein